MFLFIGILLGKLIEEMELKIQGKLNSMFHFYSGHEATISGILIALEIFNDAVPPTSSSVFFELRQKDKDYVVTVKKHSYSSVSSNFQC